MKFFMALSILVMSCASDSSSLMEPDMGDTGTADLSEDLDLEEDLTPQEMTCRRDNECPRGKTCHVNICAGARGCVFLSDFEPQIGCYFDHGLDFDEGLFSPTECVEDSDCASPEEPNCIARVCSGLTPCTEDNECPGELTCRHNFYCK